MSALHIQAAVEVHSNCEGHWVWDWHPLSYHNHVTWPPAALTSLNDPMILQYASKQIDFLVSQLLEYLLELRLDSWDWSSSILWSYAPLCIRLETLQEISVGITSERCIQDQTSDMWPRLIASQTRTLQWQRTSFYEVQVVHKQRRA